MLDYKIYSRYSKLRRILLLILVLFNQLIRVIKRNRCNDDKVEDTLRLFYWILMLVYLMVKLVY